MKAVWLAAGLVLVGVVVATLHDVLLLVFAAAIFAVPLRYAALALARVTHTTALVGLIGTIIALTSISAAVLWGWETLIAVQMKQLLRSLPAAGESLSRAVHTEPWASRIAAAIPDPSALLTGAVGLVGGMRAFLGGSVALLLDIAILIFLTVCFAAEPSTYVKGALRLVPPKRRRRLESALADAAAAIALWLRARLISMCALGTLVGIGLWIAGIPDAAALGIFAGILAFVPNVGAIAAAVPSLLLAVLLGWQHVVAVAAIYLIAHSVDDFLVTPLAERTVVRLPPALTMIAQVVLALAGGVLGIMMAAPLVAVAIVLVRRLFVEDVIEAGSNRPPAVSA